MLCLAAPALASETIRYTYDARGRLVNVVHGGPVTEGTSAAYKYDRADNRTNVTAAASWTSLALRTGDFNGDGRSDLLWRDGGGVQSPTGVVTNWLSSTSGGWIGNYANAAASAGADFKIAGVGDFNGDGRSDVFLINDVGVAVDWLTTSTGGYTDNSSVSWANLGPTWHVAGIGDFNGDGRADVAWRNDDGRFTDWLGQADGSFFGNLANAAATVTWDWHVVGIGDFNGDGRADLLWRDDNGNVTNWLGQTNGGFIQNNANLWFSTGPEWHVVTNGDFNGDGRSDVMWRRDDGVLSEWQSTSTGGVIVTSYSWVLGTDWRIAVVGDFNGDGRTDLQLRNRTGDLVQWLATPSGEFTVNTAANASVATTWDLEPRP